MARFPDLKAEAVSPSRTIAFPQLSVNLITLPNSASVSTIILS